MSLAPIKHKSMMLLALVVLTCAPLYQARAVTTAELIESSLSTECLDYEVIGICSWLYCTITGCSVRTSIRVKHYIPELVVSSYENYGDNPWEEVGELFSSMMPLDPQDGGRRTEGSPHQHTNLKFKFTDAIGHPGGGVFYKMLSSLGYSCSSDVTPYMPYFLSDLDLLAWRSNIPEMGFPEALIPGMREMGSFSDMWSPIYPRGGFVTQTHDYKVAATTAQRAADIVTRPGQPHVYQSLVALIAPSAGKWGPLPVHEGMPSTHKWQQLYPHMSMSCSIFPDGGQHYTLQEPGDYTWALWRPYKCCERRGQTLLYFTGG